MNDRRLCDGIDLLVAVLPALNGMTNPEREAFVDQYLLGHSQLQIAHDLGISRQRVAQLIRRACDRVKPLLREAA